MSHRAQNSAADPVARTTADSTRTYAKCILFLTRNETHQKLRRESRKYGLIFCLHIDYAMQYEVIDNEEEKNAKALTPIMQCESASQYWNVMQRDL
jgi:hypothetical protein